MADQPKYGPLEASDFFPDNQSARPLVPGTVARGQLRLDTHRFEGRIDGQPADTLPMDVTAELLARGQDRYAIFCSHCHDQVGNGQGMVVRRGFPAPPSYHIDRLRQAPPGHLFDVISVGFGRMPSHADQIPVDDRWAIVAYVRALQLSQHAEAASLPEEVRAKLQEEQP